jgi:polysaccharide pyruvyl transferase WcaK-like protein
MRIAVFGYYHKRNEGDDRLQHAITDMLGDEHDLVFLRHDTLPPLTFLRTCDWVLIGGGGLIFRRMGIWRDVRRWVLRSGVRVGILGVSVGNISPDMRTDIDELASVAEFFFVRDQESRNMLGYSNVQVGPDLSWLIPHAYIDRPNNAGVAVNLGYCDPVGFQPEPWMHALLRLDDTLRPLPFYYSSVPRSGDYGFLAKYFDGVHPYFSIDHLTRSHVLVGFRYHAITYAIQTGLPFVAIAYDHKVRRLCSEAGLSKLCLPPEEWERLPATLDAVNTEYEKVRAHLANIRKRQCTYAAYMRSEIIRHIESPKIFLSRWRRAADRIYASLV